MVVGLTVCIFQKNRRVFLACPQTKFKTCENKINSRAENGTLDEQQQKEHRNSRLHSFQPQKLSIYTIGADVLGPCGQLSLVHFAKIGVYFKLLMV